jgi:hypothetical protein
MYSHISQNIRHTFFQGKHCIKFSCILQSEDASALPPEQLRFPHLMVEQQWLPHELSLEAETHSFIVPYTTFSVAHWHSTLL